jgi:hypothetical protein
MTSRGNDIWGTFYHPPAASFNKKKKYFFYEKATSEVVFSLKNSFLMKRDGQGRLVCPCLSLLDF